MHNGVSAAENKVRARKSRLTACFRPALLGPGVAKNERRWKKEESEAGLRTPLFPVKTIASVN
jgi:hypothetical protein